MNATELQLFYIPPAFVCSHLLINAGKALEDLRASLFNEFRSSEGAKRLQQRICRPIVALTFNFIVAVGIIFTNKMVSVCCMPCIQVG